MTGDVQPADISIRELEARWGLSRNGLKARARALGVQLRPVSSTCTVWPGEYVELGDRLHEHLATGQPMGTFPGLKPADTDGTATASTALTKAPATDLAALVTAITEAAVPAAAADPLARARGLREAADDGLVLTSADLAGLLGQGVSSWGDGEERYGYRFHRHTQGRQVLWTVERAITASNRPALTAAVGTRPKRVGFATTPEVIEARVEVLSSGAALFASNLIG